MTVFLSGRRPLILLLWIAMSVVPAVCAQCPQGDLNRDCQVKLTDFVLLAEQWMEAEGSANIDGVGGVELSDLMLMSDNWLARDSYVVISELSASNGNIIFDEDGDSSDWIELFNPMSVGVSLEGWYLTDDRDDVDKWRFGKVGIDAGGYLVVYASGKDRRDSKGALHTNFKLDADGDFLALVKPDAKSIAFSFDPEFPRQFRDISYGIAQTTSLAKLVSRKSPGKLLVCETEAELDDDWNETVFDDEAWRDVTLGIGFDTSLGGSHDVEQTATFKTAQQSSTGFGYGAELAVDGDYNTFTHTLNSDENATWQVDLDGVYYISKIVLYNRLGCCQSRLRDITVTVRDPDDTVDTFVSALLNPENVLMSPEYITIDLMELTGSAVYGGIVKVSRTPDPDLSGNDGQGVIDDATVLSLSEVEVFASQTPNAYSEIFEENVFDQMFGKNASAHVRIPFQFSQTNHYSDLSMSIRYDDGFVAYLNGSEIARRNAPDNVAWNSSAIVERAKDPAAAVETINLTNYLHLLDEGENVLSFQALNYSVEDEDFLLDVELSATDNVLGGMCYMKDTSPGTVNNPGLPGVVVDIKFSHDRGFYDWPFDVEIATETAGATIVYTVDGSEPTLNHGTKVYPADAQTPPAGSVRISTTTTLRAAAFKDDYQPTDCDTQTYIFLDDVISSSVMRTAITGDAQYKPQMRDALTDLPTVSLVTDNGINKDAPVKTSIEWITADGSAQFQEDMGLRYFGGGWAGPFAKQNFRLYFKREFGAVKLRFPLFEGHEHGIDPVEVFDQLELRAGSHDMNQRGFYMSNRFTDDTMLDMGNVNPHGQFVHVYLNGTYWGQYHLRERWNADMLGQYLGGKKEDYEAVNGNWNVGGWADPGVPYDGDGSAWTRVKSLRNDYEAIKPFLDVGHYIDFMLMFMFGNSEDEYRCVGAVGAGSGFKWFLNDADGFTRNAGNRTGMYQPGRKNGDGPGSIFSMLLGQGHPDYKTLLGDRIHKHFFNDGAMTPEKNTARLMERCDQVERAFIAEAARWGYRTPSAWESAKNSYINTVLTSRTATVIEQYKAAGFYPAIFAPIFNINGAYKHGGYVPSNAQLSMELSDSSSFTDVELVAESVPVRVCFPADNSPGATWTELDYVPDGSWSDGSTTTGVGYEMGSGYQNWIGTDVKTQMYGKNTSVFCRIEFDYDNSQIFSELQLFMKYDDAFVAYLNGTEIGNSGNITNAIPGQTQVGSHEAIQSYEQIDIVSNALSLLVGGRNVLSVHGINIGISSGDMIVHPKLIGRINDATQGPLPILFTFDGSDPRLSGGAPNPNAVSYSGPFAMTHSAHVRSRTFIHGLWSALNEAVYVVGPVGENLRVTEIMYHPSDPNTEFIELQNIGSEAINLNLVKFANGVDFTFPSVTVGAGEHVLVVENVSEFAKRYDTTGLRIAGEYAGSLANGGEKIELLDVLGGTILEFAFKDGWYDITDGGGFSLTVNDASNTDVLLWGDKDSWKASTRAGGSPGEADTGPSPNDVVINEVLAHSDIEPDDWIELYNRTDSEINMGGWFISDNGDDEPNLMKYRIAEGTTIAANGFIVFNEFDHFGRDSIDPGSLIGFALSENGETVYLTSAEGDVLTGLRISRSFGASSGDVAFGEYIKSTGGTDFVAMSENSPGAANKYPLVGPVVISEIMYHPDDNDDAEYVSLLNISGGEVKLYDPDTGEPWRFTDEGGIEYYLRDPGPMGFITMAAGERIFLIKDLGSFGSKFTVPLGTRILEWAGGPVDDRGSLSNGGERIEISMPGDVDSEGMRQYIRVDRVNYDDKNGWPTEADGKGSSLRRVNDESYGNDAANWRRRSPFGGRL